MFVNGNGSLVDPRKHSELVGTQEVSDRFGGVAWLGLKRWMVWPIPEEARRTMKNPKASIKKVHAESKFSHSSEGLGPQSLALLFKYT